MRFFLRIDQTPQSYHGYNTSDEFRSYALPLSSPEPTDPSSENHLPQTRAHLRQFALQCAAALVVLSVAWPYFVLRNEPLPWPQTALSIGGIALLIASFTHQAWWWRVIHTVFAPMAWLISTQSIDPGWFLLAFILLLLVYRGALTGQIPLYLSNTETGKMLAVLCADSPKTHFIDLGAGVGSVVLPLARALADARIEGIENAPATWLIGYLRTLGQKNCLWRWGSLWHIDLSEFTVVYAFLSPTPMPALWEKVQREMQAGSLFISNSFPVPDIEADNIVEIDDARQTRLFCYRR